jgi:hypothetical protein
LKIQNRMLRFLVGAVVFGVLVSIATGVVENPPEASIVGARYYGYPLVWRVTKTLQPTELRFADLALDALFWSVVFFLALIIIQKAATPFLKKRTPSHDTVSLRDAEAETEHVPRQKRSQVEFSVFFLFLAFLMKVVGEFVHEVIGHGFFVLLFGGEIIRVHVSLLWPYELSFISWNGSFEAWHMPWIDGGGILVCFIVSCILQVLLLLRFVRDWRFSSPLFWLSFWTFLNGTGYLIVGGVEPFGDVAALIAGGILTQESSLIIGLIVFLAAFFSLSRIFVDILLSGGVVSHIRRLRIFISFFWLAVPLTTAMALIGLRFPSSSLFCLPLSFVPSILALVVPLTLPEFILGGRAKSGDHS